MKTIEKGCPLCDNDLKGDEENSFYCGKCNLLFKRSDLGMKRA